MSDSELVDYIQEQTQQGVAAQDLRVSLMEVGWHEADINNALHDVAAGLHPTTPGASIHEDLAQVRGMVAHLASRVHSIEATLASAGALGMQEQLPSGTVDSSHAIAAPKKPHWFVRSLAVFALMAVFVSVGTYATVLISQQAATPLKLLSIGAVIGALLIVAAIVTMRLRRTWAAELLIASAVTLWGMEVLVSWRVYHVMGWMVALALGVLLLVIAFVAGRWTQRLA